MAWWATRVGGRTQAARQRFLVGALVFSLSLAAAATALRLREIPPAEYEVNSRPIAIPEDGYVSSVTCQACHPQQYETWHDSYHPRMTQRADPESVLGDFNDVRLETDDGRTFLLQREGDTFWVEFDEVAPETALGPPPRQRQQIVMITGSHHMQVYWYATGDRRSLGQLDFVYLLEDRAWVPRKSVFLQPPRFGSRSENGRWNHTCIQCHTTNGQPRLEEMDTRVAEFGIACEACHGPAVEHVASNQDPRRRYQQHRSEGPDETITNPEHLSPRLSSQVCGSCHGISFRRGDERQRFLEDGHSYVPGDDLRDTRILAHAPEGLEHMGKIFDGSPEYLALLLKNDPNYFEKQFWTDGMVRVSGREYSGLLNTPCFVAGELSCLSCHTLHQQPDDPRPRLEWAADQLAPGMRTNQACISCHGDFASDEALTAHTYHPVESSGSSCYNCHMPYTTYGLLKAIRSHQVDSPSVAASLATGRPNACNQCHLDKTLRWSGEHLNGWYGIPKPPLDEVEAAVPASLIWMLRGDAGQRALIAWSMGWEDALEASGNAWQAPFLAQMLVDPYDAVRYISGRSLRRLPGYAAFEYDFVGPEADRSAAARRAAEQWWKGPHPKGQVANAQELLDDPNGLLPKDIFAQLLRQRNDRYVELAE